MYHSGTVTTTFPDTNSMRMGISTSLREQSMTGFSARNSARLDLRQQRPAVGGTQTDAHLRMVRMAHYIGACGQQIAAAVVFGFEQIIRRLSASAVLKVGAGRYTANLKCRHRSGRSIHSCIGNTGYLDRYVVVRAGELDEPCLVVVLPAGERFHRKGRGRIIERIVAGNGLPGEIAAVGKGNPAEIARSDVAHLRMVGIAQTDDTVISGLQLRQFRRPCLHFVRGKHAVGNATVLRIENIHFDPTNLVAENLGLSIALIAQQQRIGAEAVAQVLAYAGGGEPSEQQQAENSIPQFHISPCMFT